MPWFLKTDLGYFTILSYNKSSSLSTVSKQNRNIQVRFIKFTWGEGREWRTCPLICHLNFIIVSIKNHLHNSDLKSDFLKPPHWRGIMPFWDRTLSHPFYLTKHSQCNVKVRKAKGSHQFEMELTTVQQAKAQRCIKEAINLRISYRHTSSLGRLGFSYFLFSRLEIELFRLSWAWWTQELHSYPESHSEEKFSKPLPNLKEQLWSGGRFKSALHEILSWFIFYLWSMRVIITSNLKRSS